MDAVTRMKLILEVEVLCMLHSIHLTDIGEVILGNLLASDYILRS